MVMIEIHRDIGAFILISTLFLLASSNAPELLFDLIWGLLQ